ncbi:hypothetical protein [Mesorhizobium sp. f-mel]
MENKIGTSGPSDGNGFDQELLISESELEAARSEREGAAWWLQNIEDEIANNETESNILHRASNTPISDRAFNLIIEFEVSSQATYEAKYRGAIWPQGASGVTIGIGYDVGYVTKTQLSADWQNAISAGSLAALAGVVGINGNLAKAAAARLKGKVDVPWKAAISVHRGKVMPRWVGLVEDSLPNTNMLDHNALGALVSLTYNRGASFQKDGDRYGEMRNIRAHMANKAFSRIPNEFRSMKRIWPTVPGLQMRREREARLFELGARA